MKNGTVFVIQFVRNIYFFLKITTTVDYLQIHFYNDFFRVCFFTNILEQVDNFIQQGGSSGRL